MSKAFQGEGFVFVFMALPKASPFFCSLPSYYFGILQFIVRGMAWVMSRIMRLSGAYIQLLANIFCLVKTGTVDC